MDLTVRVPLARRRGISERVSLTWALGFSTLVHLAIAWRLTFGAMGDTSRGEDGYEGAGGATFEVSVEGPEADAPMPLPSAPAPAPIASSTPAAPASRPVARVLPREADGTENAASTAATPASPEEQSGPASASIAAAGSGDTSTSSGRLHGRDDPGLRALLQGSVGGAIGGSSLGSVAIYEDAARCPDAVEGTWTAHRYSPEFRDWAHFTLNITRTGDRLTGMIHTRMWRGYSTDTRPPPCTADGWDYTVEMQATGSVTGDSFDFGAREHHISHVECASPMFGYNPDHFSGRFDTDRDQLRTMNNDGGRDVNAAYTFRRSSCQP